MIIKRIISKCRKLYYTSSPDRYVKYLRKLIRVGEGTYFIDPRNVQIDLSRPELLEIGKHCFIHRGTVILTHDWASWCFVYSHNEFLPSHGRVIIGDNVWLGENVTILKGVTIGDNVIIGYGSIVTKSIPSNSVAVGIPAKVICSYEAYFEKRKNAYVNECIEYARSIISQGRKIKKEDFYDDYPCFVDGTNCDSYEYPYKRIFNDEQFLKWRASHKSYFNGFEEFVQAITSPLHK